MDGSIQLFPPNHPGSLVAHLQELEFSTDVVGDSRDSSFHINASSVSLLALDDGGRWDAHPSRSLRGVAVWTVSHNCFCVCLFAELSRLRDMLFSPRCQT
jgi:autophagy-related protein 2